MLTHKGCCFIDSVVFTRYLSVYCGLCGLHPYLCVLQTLPLPLCFADCGLYPLPLCFANYVVFTPYISVLQTTWSLPFTSLFCRLCGLYPLPVCILLTMWSLTLPLCFADYVVFTPTYLFCKTVVFAPYLSVLQTIRSLIPPLCFADYVVFTPYLSDPDTQEDKKPVCKATHRCMVSNHSNGLANWLPARTFATPPLMIHQDLSFDNPSAST